MSAGHEHQTTKSTQYSHLYCYLVSLTGGADQYNQHLPRISVIQDHVPVVLILYCRPYTIIVVVCHRGVIACVYTVGSVLLKESSSGHLPQLLTVCVAVQEFCRGRQ